MELINEYTVEISNEFQRRSEGTNSQKIASFFIPRMKVQKNQVPCDFSEMQLMLKGENDTIMKISDACATQITNECQDRIESKCHKITSFFKPRI